jgi:hypothetical protein
MAKAIIAGSAGFPHRAEIRRLKGPVGTFSLAVLTTFDGTKDLHAERQIFQVTTDHLGSRRRRGGSNPTIKLAENWEPGFWTTVQKGRYH